MKEYDMGVGHITQGKAENVCKLQVVISARIVHSRVIVVH
jgi:hypothetical protein